MTRSAGSSSTLEPKAKRSPKSSSGAKWQDVKLFVETVMPKELGVACVDLDSVLLYHDQADGTSRLGRVLPHGRMLVDLLRKRWRVVVLTARVHDLLSIHEYLHNNFVFVDEVTNLKPPADAYFDDKAYRISKNWL